MPMAWADINLWIAFTARILSFFSPCVLPLIPSYLTYITGLSFGQLEGAHPGAKIRLTVISHSLTFILGFSTVFIVLGGIVGLASAGFQEHLRAGLVWVERLGGLLILLFGVHLTGLFHFGILLGEKRIAPPPQAEWLSRHVPGGAGFCGRLDAVYRSNPGLDSDDGCHLGTSRWTPMLFRIVPLMR